MIGNQMYDVCDECYQLYAPAIRLRCGCGMLADSVLIPDSGLTKHYWE
jgi:hypothetical protein